MRQNIKTHYGKVVLVRTLCPSCEEMSIVQDGKTMCCDTVVETEKVHKTVRVTRGSLKKVQLCKDAKRELLESQGGRCFYCNTDFNNRWYISKKMKIPKQLRVEYDHVIPFSYAPMPDQGNFVASCNVCNLIKYDKVFRCFEEAVAHILRRREALGYIVE